MHKESNEVVEGVPVAWVAPAERRGAGAQLALWLPPFSSTKESTLPFLRELADAGFVAVSLDPWQHGERGSESREELQGRVFGAFRRYMWPILGQTTLDCLRVIDWAAAELGTGQEIVAGGVSMGGDIAVALAGIDARVRRVASIVATPDWTRPGMHDIFDLSRELPQGQADTYAQWFYEQLNPMTHLDAYGAGGPAITFECGADDTHVPPEAALRFRAALAQTNPAAAGHIRVNLHPGLNHMSTARSAAPGRKCLAWFLEPDPPTEP